MTNVGKKMTQLDYWLWLSLKEGMNATKMVRLLKAFDSPKAIFEMKRDDFGKAARINKRTVTALCDKSVVRVEEVKEHCKRIGICVLTIDSPYYPKCLKEISAPPHVLYVRCRHRYNLNNYTSIGVVGTREATDYGVVATESIAYGAANNGFVVVSGMAKGVDAAAHRGAINAGGITIAVVGGGLETAYPYCNKELMSEIIRTGMVISEYPPYSKPERHHFPERNRIIAGLSKGVLVTEAPGRSGALITANYALEENRDLFAVPGDITRPKSAGANNLIKEGAYPVTSARDIVEHYNIDYVEPVKVITEQKTPKEVVNNDLYHDLTEEEKHIISKLSLTPINFDALLAATGVTPDKLASTITLLEIKGKVKTLPGKNFTLNI
jgi:DNA processing protein